MAYADIDDIFARYAPIHTMVGTGVNEVTSVEVSSVFIADAESLVNAYIAGRYEVPLTAPVERIVTMVTADLATFQMMAEKLPAVPDFMKDRYERSLAILEKLSEGDMRLSSGTLVTTGDQFAFSSTSSYHPIFSPVLDPLDQAADIDYINDEKEARESEISSVC